MSAISETTACHPVDNPPGVVRPPAITFVCTVMFLGSLFCIQMLLDGQARKIADWYPAFLALSGTVGCICLAGLWQMRRWAPFAYLGLVAFGQITAVVNGFWEAGGLLGPAIVIAVAFSHLGKMR